MLIFVLAVFLVLSCLATFCLAEAKVFATEGQEAVNATLEADFVVLNTDVAGKWLDIISRNMNLKLFQRFCGGFMKWEADLDGYLSVCSFGFTEEPTTHAAGRNMQVQFHLSGRERGGELMQVYHEILVGQEQLPNIGDIVALVVSSSMLALCRYHLEQWEEACQFCNTVPHNNAAVAM